MGDMEINGNPVAYGIGKTGNLAGKLTVKALAEKVKQAFDLPFVLVLWGRLMDMEVESGTLSWSWRKCDRRSHPCRRKGAGNR